MLPPVAIDFQNSRFVLNQFEIRNVQRLEREIADRSAAVEEVDAFKNQLARAIKAFMAADEAVRGLNDHDSEIDTKIAAAIDEHLRAIDRLCRFGIDGGFGEEHPIKEY